MFSVDYICALFRLKLATTRCSVDMGCITFHVLVVCCVCISFNRYNIHSHVFCTSTMHNNKYSQKTSNTYYISCWIYVWISSIIMLGWVHGNESAIIFRIISARDAWVEQLSVEYIILPDPPCVTPVIFFAPGRAGYSDARCAALASAHRMGQNALAIGSDVRPVAIVCVQLRDLADRHDNCVAISHLYHVLGHGRKCICNRIKKTNPVCAW